ncbi:AAA family ATPase [Bremerella sp.]|uniref:AAA family ATPase n=1 Tax=Bremerella sp. TaxID=2795602 RepID=UPI00391D4F86
MASNGFGGESNGYSGGLAFPTTRGAGSGGVEATGILDSRILPDTEYLDQWDAVIVDECQKTRLLAQAILNFTLREKVNRARLPQHGLIVLHGPPGTGKTSLARGLSARTAEVIGSLGEFRFVEVEPHALASAALGKSQRAVRELLGQTIAEQAERGPLIVLLDEVETLAADRSRMSMDANPIDVHRATDAVLAQLDQLAATYPHLLFIATSNFTQAVDGAFLSRADLIEHVGLPNVAACRAILTSSVEELARVFPTTHQIIQQREFESAIDSCLGLDGRRIRKLIISACALRKETAIDPGQLTAADLLEAVTQAQKEAKSAQKDES